MLHDGASYHVLKDHEWHLPSLCVLPLSVALPFPLVSSLGGNKGGGGIGIANCCQNQEFVCQFENFETTSY
jgi:hypothetical protein